ncbi:glutamate--tRNA ligase [Nocardia panacis]|uniref:Glutamate--tRNA ligase n=1 Tax=Nocardia panacis TaxID=2340916 RepID=A0A3A4KDA9_9NOCA|nr:glutamate--tRNA ligase [Nocardia panacis]RJO78423.1 glutamate--tRNA ligase [Nocardia panacis]
MHWAVSDSVRAEESAKPIVVAAAVTLTTGFADRAGTFRRVTTRVRFAPSPTGMFHVGGARSALFNWAVARRSGGRFVLRIEDTDQARNKPEWVQGIITALATIGISEADPAFEGPYFQSANAEAHKTAASRLFAGKRAYYCDCTREQVTERTGKPDAGYDGLCRDRGLEYAQGRALRFRTPDDGETVVSDRIRGETAFPNRAIEDFVIARGDGTPLFLLANVVDDVDERITEVIRGEEHLPNTPKQQLLWEALGQTPPAWAHLPVIVNEKRQKLSKRRDKVALEDYIAEGYLPDALVNYLMLLGWGPRDGGPEIRPYAELEAQFDIADVTKAGAFFDVVKLKAFNGEYIRALDISGFIAVCQPWLRAPRAPWTEGAFDPEVFAAVAPLAQSRIAVLGVITAYVDFLFLDKPVTDETAWSKAMKPGAGDMLAAAAETLTGADWNAEAIRAAIEAAAAEVGLKLGKAQAPVRVAVTGRTVGLPLFESLEALGRERTLARIEAARANLV